MEKNYKVSIVVPIFNVEKYLRQCLESLVNQTLKDIEIICVNDGSTDSSLEIIEEFAAKDKRIKIINKTNSGYGHSMNCGLKAAKGKYLGIVESDDYAELDMFQSLYDVAEEKKVEVVKSNFYNYFSTPKTKNEYCKVLPFQQYDEIINPVEKPEIFRVLPCIWAGLYKRELLVNNNIYFTETPGASYQDTAFNFKIWACASKVYFLDRAFLHYRQDNENSSVKSKAKVFSICDEYTEIEAFLNRDKDKKKAFNELKNAIKYKAYLWNYNRLESDAQKLFLEIFIAEFRKEKAENALDKNLFSQSDWKHLNFLLSTKGNNKVDVERLIIEAQNTVKETKTFKIGKIVLFLPRILLVNYRLIKVIGFKATIKKDLERVKKIPQNLRKTHPKLYWRIRNIFIPRIFSYRSDLPMHIRILTCMLLEKLHLDSLNPRMRKIKAAKNRHEGERCFIVGTGPSLRYEDLEALKNEYTFSVNTIFLTFKHTTWRPTYYAFVDAYGYDELSRTHNIDCGNIPQKEAYIHYRIKPKNKTGKERYCLIHYGNHTIKRMKNKEIIMYDNPAVCVYDAFTVTNMAINLAVYMGFKEIYLLGVDCNYRGKKMHLVETTMDEERKNKKYYMDPEVSLMLTGYEGVKKYADKKRVKIYNATRGGALEVFPRINFDEVIKK